MEELHRLQPGEQRFNTVGVRVDLCDSSGDDEASGLDGLEMRIHANAQVQLGQIMKPGKLVVHVDVGQTFLYGTKEGAIHIRNLEHRSVGERLNGGHFHQLTDADWALINSCLVENEKHFGIKVDDLLTHNGKKMAPGQILCKVGAMKPAEAVKVIDDGDVNLGMVDSVGKK